MKVALVVEGHGEAIAVPLLVRRIAEELLDVPPPEVLHPARVPRDRLLQQGELERTVDLMSQKVGADGGILVLVDADDECPATLGPQMQERARKARPDRATQVVLAVREYEAWFMASSLRLARYRSFASGVQPPVTPEAIRGAKEWLSAQMERGYSPTLDQPAFTACFDLEVTRATCPSFDKLVRAVQALLGA